MGKQLYFLARRGGKKRVGIKDSALLGFALFCGSAFLPPELSDAVPRGRWQLCRLRGHRVTIVSAQMDTRTDRQTDRQSGRGLSAAGAAPSLSLGLRERDFASFLAQSQGSRTAGKREPL